jgi:hypothetical protein
MPLYFLPHDAGRFREVIRPALGDAWRRRSFEPCRALCAALAPAAAAYADRYHTGPDEPLLARAARGLPFDRDFWRLLVGEVLLYAAAAVPEVPTAPDTLLCLLAPERCGHPPGPRELFVPIEQAHFGARDLVFGGGFYRPDTAAYNDGADVARLAEYLAAVEPARWSTANLAPLRELGEADRADELEYARDVFPRLRDLYREAAAAGQVVVCEVL